MNITKPYFKCISYTVLTVLILYPHINYASHFYANMTLAPNFLVKNNNYDFSEHEPTWRPIHDSQIRFIDQIGGLLMGAYLVEFEGKQYVAKMASDDTKIRNHLLPQAKYLIFFKQRHPELNIAHAEHFLRLENTYVILFEKLNGIPLAKMKGRLPLIAGLKMILETARIIKQYLDCGIYHWDISPYNIMLCDDGIKLLDNDLNFSSREEFIERELWKRVTFSYASINRTNNAFLERWEIEKKDDEELFSPSDEADALLQVLEDILVPEESKKYSSTKYDFDSIDSLIGFLEQQINILEPETSEAQFGI